VHDQAADEQERGEKRGGQAPEQRQRDAGRPRAFRWIADSQLPPPPAIRGPDESRGAGERRHRGGGGTQRGRVSEGPVTVGNVQHHREIIPGNDGTCAGIHAGQRGPGAVPGQRCLLALPAGQASLARRGQPFAAAQAEADEPQQHQPAQDRQEGAPRMRGDVHRAGHQDGRDERGASEQ